jgi:TetR/AcrR family transcriptional repressor of nem operon
MPWPRRHKALTRRRIVEAAAAAFRAGGTSVRVEDVMARAGLTHGGFYAHFTSKIDLLRNALEQANRQTVELLSDAVAALPEEDRFLGAVDAYLSPGHLAHPERGCPLASLGAEIARIGGAPKRAIAAGVRRRLAWLRELLPEDQRDAVADSQLIGTLACLIGGLVLARAAGGTDAAAVLAGCREFLHATIETPAKRMRARRGVTRRAVAGRPARGERRRSRTDRGRR